MMNKFIVLVFILIPNISIAESETSNKSVADNLSKAMVINLSCLQQKLKNISSVMNDQVADRLEVNCINAARSSLVNK